jgi:hypothetical protein
MRELTRSAKFIPFLAQAEATLPAPALPHGLQTIESEKMEG